MNRHQHGQQRPPQQAPSWKREDIKRAITEGGKALVELAEQVGKTAKNQGLTTSQIRNIYGMVKRLEMRASEHFDEHELMMLKPKMAYAAARASGKGAETLADVLSTAIDTVQKSPERFRRFVDLFEAI